MKYSWKAICVDTGKSGWTNREIELNKLSNNIELLAKALIKTEIIDDGYWGYDGEDEHWVEDYEELYTSPNGENYSDRDYEQCVIDTIEWLNKESE